jgi:hypothetical protein
MKNLFALVIVLLLACAAAPQSPSKILKQAENALGGTRTWRAVQSFTAVGHIKRVGDGASGSYILNLAKPNLINESFDLAGFEIETGYNGRSAWARNSRDGLQTLTGQQGTNLQSKASYRNNLWLNAKDEKLKIVPAGSTTIEGKAANVLVLTTQKGVSIRMSFDSMSGLLMRDEIPAGDIVEITDYGDYRETGGLKQPFFRRMKVGPEVYEVRLDSIKLNAPVARSEFDIPRLSTEKLPDIPALLKELQANEDKVEEMLDHYSFLQKSIKREMGKDGDLREGDSETHQMSFYKGYRISRLIEKNGRPLKAEKQAKEDNDAAKQVDEIEKRIVKMKAREADQPQTDDRSQPARISVAELLRASKLLNPRRERFDGRDCVVFDFEPNPAFDTSKAKSMLKFFGKTAGVIWIDEKDKQVARVEAVLYESMGIGGGVLAKLKKGASFTIEKQRFNDEIWLPSQAEINLSVRVLMVKGLDINMILKSYDYRRFETEVKGAAIDEIKKP